MHIRYRQRNVQRLAILSLVTALSAMAVLFSAPELCACGPTSATSAGNDAAVAEPLSLTLTAPTICETSPAQGYSGLSKEEDGKGGYKYVWEPTVWYDVSEVAVAWEVTGGIAPFTLVIDGESEDINGTYQGSSGTASVSCAQSHIGSFTRLEARGYNEEPEVDSGWKTVTATVTDATGQTTAASLFLYVILETTGTGTILEGGKTYSIHGKFLTIPSGINFEIGAAESGVGGTESYDLLIPGGPVVIALEWDTHREVARFVQLPEGDYDSITSEQALSTLLDELVASAGKLPAGLPGDTP